MHRFMRLKRIKLAGFKSFVEPTTIPFDGDMTAIVGPNGCGKSNIIDAVRWVLGESNAKNLRGDAMTDVIFNGSSARKPVGQCSVELVFDNSAGRIAGEYASYNELAVKRLVTRDAQSFYYLNGAKCRRRDVTDLFLGTGLGPRSYAIIEQGMISKLIESKPQELRVFIEEAAGVSKYKERRKDTVTRIKHTHENLIRLDDVRNELGQQIDKLQEQAQIAQRYTTLKAQQRKLQGQITALKWRIEADIIASIEHVIVELTNDLAALQTNQQSSETQLVALQFKQEYLNEEIAVQQANKYQLATSITSLEQELKYNQTRTAQINQELADTNAQCIAHEQALKGLDSQLEDAQRIVAALEPDHISHVANYQQLTEDLALAEGRLEMFKNQTLSQVNAHQQSTMRLEHCQSQIQALQSVINKSQIGFEHTSLEVQSVEDEIHDLVAQIVIQESLVGDLRRDVTNHLAIKNNLELAVNECQSLLTNLIAEQSSLQRQLTEDETSLTVLKTLQSAQTITRDSSYPTTPLLQWLDVQSQDLHWFDAVLNFMQQPDITTSASNEALDAIRVNRNNAVNTWFTKSFTKTKNENTLAQKCQNEYVPSWFNTIHLRENLNNDEMLQEWNSLPVGDSILLKSGMWLQHGRIYQSGQCAVQHGSDDSETQSVLQRSQQISKLENTIAQVTQQLQTQLNSINEHKAVLAAQQTEYEVASTTYVQSHLALQLAQQACDQLVLQQQQTNKQLAKLNEDKQRLANTLADEKRELVQLNENLALYKLELAELSECQIVNVAQETQFKDNVSKLQIDVQQAQHKVHQSELALQKARSSFSFVVQNKSNQVSSLADVKMKIRMLEDQAAALTEPFTIDQVKLSQLLEQQITLDQNIQSLQLQDSELSLVIKQTEKGQHGNQQGVEKIKETIQGKELALQGHRVRASGFVEQLEQIGVHLDSILPELAANTDADTLQRELEETADEIMQLGAVNLAAITEYEIQFERKNHLEQQNADLCSALNTLESAMKKIDNETKARFKATYDQVNSDLKSLFPKVFGGGTAYLELTGDDMLDTGVTIMARPPGKKNSTIHLLSGGEKALTALSLVFAIFRLNPAPFCLLDEVDAPLDDANVGRFCKLVSEMSKTVQFIYISHNKIAMEMASHLTGVTMAEPGVSRMVAVDIDEAVAITQA